MDRRQAVVAGPGAVAPVVLEVVEKRADQWRVEIVAGESDIAGRVRKPS